MKKIFIPIITSLLFTGCTKNDVIEESDNAHVLQLKNNIVNIPTELFSEQQIKSIVIDSLDHERNFRWNNADIKTICSGARVTKLISVGYKPATFSGDVDAVIHTINIRDKQWKDVHDALIEFVQNTLHAENPAAALQDLIYEDDPVLPIIIFKTDNTNVITGLYNLVNVRYIEPYGFWPYNQSCSSSGCSASGNTVNAYDFSLATPSCLLPWNFNNLNIPAAWSTASGNGIKIGIIDAGISNVQSLLGSQFNNGYSNSSRSISLDYTYGGTAYSSCTHGTSMCGLAVGPRNSMNAPTGVAFKSNLLFIRGCDDVVLDASSELSGVKNALVRLGDNTTVKIISMSVGTPFYSSTLYDGVSYAYGKGKMIFAAAGTSFSFTSWWGVIYPAAFPQCIAVTGVKENGNKCSDCHDGSEVRFTIPMERDVDNDRHGVSLSYTGYAPSYIGGSSCATAMCAGIAALVWSEKPSLTRTQVFDCMRMTAQYPVPVTNKGFGNPNASAAVARASTL